MPTTRNSRAHSAPARPNIERMESPKEITHDVIEYMVEYARQNPAYAALGCMGVGFILGWKLKPW